MVSTRGPRGRGEKRKAAVASRDLSKSLSTPKAKTPAKTPANPAAKTPASAKKAATPKSAQSVKANGERVRIWWPPTTNKSKTELSGMYWPAKVISYVGTARVSVLYDNKETEQVRKTMVVPANPPVAHGKETVPITAGEFVEVSNESARDPAEWVACVKEVLDKNKFTVFFPFHDAEDEVVAAASVRRARVYDSLTGSWSCVRPWQTWKDGDVASPVDLDTIPDKEFYELIKKGNPKPKGETGKQPAKEKPKPAPAAAAAPKTAAPASKKEKEAKVATPKKEKMMSQNDLPAAVAVAATAAADATVGTASPKKTGFVAAVTSSLRSVFGAPEEAPPAAAAAPAAVAPAAPKSPVAPKAPKVPKAPKEPKEPKGERKRKEKPPPAEGEDAAGPAGKKKKRKKDKEAPKKAKSSYLCFLDLQRPRLMAENKDMIMKELMPKLAELWQKATDADKEEAVKLSQEDTLRYEREMVKWKEVLAERAKAVPPPPPPAAVLLPAAPMMAPPPGPPPPGWMFPGGAGMPFPMHPDAAPPPAAGKKVERKKKDPKAPRKAHSAYICFSKAFRTQQKEIAAALVASGGVPPPVDFDAMSKRIGEAWRELTEEDRQVYYGIAKEESKKYEEAMKDYTATKKEEEAAKAKTAAAAPPPPPSAFPPPGGLAGPPNPLPPPPEGMMWVLTPGGPMLAPAQMHPMGGAAPLAPKPPMPTGAPPPAAAAVAAPPAAKPAKQAAKAPKSLKPKETAAAGPPPAAATAAAEPVPEVTTPAPAPTPLQSLDSINMPKIQDGMKKFATEETYYLILDKMREDRALVLEANSLHIGKKKKPDWKAFLSHVLGYEKTMQVWKV